MPKTAAPRVVEVPAAQKSFSADALPDVFDGRDRLYRAGLTPLPPRVDVRPEERHVLTQEGNSCTGHAVAAMVNAVLHHHPGPTGEPIKVSPYMLYAMARRYDEFEGEADLGSSLRGALKGWYHHGMLRTEDWPSLGAEPDLDLDRDLAAKAMCYPLGAFYRVNAFRLDDMQSAVTELYGIAASAAIHEGWVAPTLLERDGRTIAVIQRRENSPPLGGHAFAIVGYNEVGFLVQNSWGKGWGVGGFATLPYDDWLASAYDAWVARPGVRSLVTAGRAEKLIVDGTGALATRAGPDLVLLRDHVVNLGNDGRLSTDGRFRSSPAQIDAMFEQMAAHHDHWATSGPREPRRIVLYAHGGLNDESTGLEIAQKHLNWWLNNQVYPVTFAWQTGAVETLVNELTDLAQGRLPSGGLGDHLVEQFDRLVEKLAGSRLRWMWSEMKENAEKASGGSVEPWPGGIPARVADLPGATLTAARLQAYCQAHAGVEVHLVGHSAGSIFHTHLLPQLVEREVPVTSVTFLAPAVRADLFAAKALPHLRQPGVRFASFALNDQRELDDVVGVGGTGIYQKSLLYLVARGFERPAPGETEVPLLGMQRFAETHLDAMVREMGHGELVWAPSTAPPASRTDARTHGGVDDDAATMTSTLLRVLECSRDALEPVTTYEPHARLVDPGPRPVSAPTIDGLRWAGWQPGSPTSEKS